MIKSLKNIKIYGMLNGENVEITKIDLINKSCNIIKSVYGKKIRFAYNTKDELGKSLIIDNFTNIEITEE